MAESETNPLDPEYLAMLRCPISGGPLVERGAELWCQESQKAYPISDGIPVLLAEEARDLTDRELSELAD